MTTKHTPATPLPWETTSMVGDEWHERVVRRGWPSSELRDLDCGNHQDAAYIAHAANAYPKLVEALLESADDANRAGGSRADLNSILDAISLRARSVLIELGEDA